MHVHLRLISVEHQKRKRNASPMAIAEPVTIETRVVVDNLSASSANPVIGVL